MFRTVQRSPHLKLLRVAIGALLPLAVVAAATNIPILRQGLLFLAPLLLLLALWAAGVDAEPLLELLDRRRPNRAASRLVETGRRVSESCFVRGGRLIATSLAGRAPPRSLIAPAI